MNSKKTNCISAILNIVLLVTLLLRVISSKIIAYPIFSAKNGELKFFETVQITIFASLFIFNIISAIQNKDDKKLLYWKIILGLITMIQIILCNNIRYGIKEWVGKIFFGVVPMIIAIIDLILIKKNRPKVIQVISYIVVILSSIFLLLDDMWYLNSIYVGIVWCVISAIMQLIYTHIQEDDNESQPRKIANTIIYYILQAIIAIGIFIMTVYCLLAGKINSEKLKSESTEIVNKIFEQSSYNKEEFILVERNSKYGFINEKGKEVIEAEYDILSPLLTFNINDQDCECAFAKKDNDFYIILKNKKIIDLKETNSDYFNIIYEYIYSNSFNTYKEEQYRNILMTAGNVYLHASEKVKSGEGNIYSSSDEKN